jgi:hypothetical protein
LAQLFSERARCCPARWPDHEARPGRTVTQYLLHVIQAYRDATRCWLKILPRNMKEDGAPAALDAGSLIVAGLHHNVIETVRTLQIFVSCSVGQIYPAIIISVAYGFAPTPALPDR